MKKSNPIALAPIGVFLVLYLGLGVLFEYVLKIPLGFDIMPMGVAVLAALVVAGWERLWGLSAGAARRVLRILCFL